MSRSEAIEYVSGCLTGRIKPEDKLPEFYVPDDLADSLIVRRYMLDGKIINTVSLGDIWTKIYYPYKAEYPDDDPGYKEYFINKMARSVKHLVYSSVSTYYMLHPISTALKKDRSGKYHLISCTIGYSGNGESKELIAENLSELEVRLELELNKLMEGRNELFEYKLRTIPVPNSNTKPIAVPTDRIIQII